MLGVEDRGENDQLDVMKEFHENISRKEDGRYEVNVPWVPGARGENDQLDVMKEFHENISRKEDGRYEVNVPWVPGASLGKTNEVQSRKRLQS